MTVVEVNPIVCVPTETVVSAGLVVSTLPLVETVCVAVGVNLNVWEVTPRVLVSLMVCDR